MTRWIKWVKKIPSTVQLSRKGKYEVVWTDTIKDDTDVLGETRFDPKQIVIKNGQSPKETVHTYVHEILHAVSAEYDVNLTEAQVRKLEKALYYILKDGNIFK